MQKSQVKRPSVQFSYDADGDPYGLEMWSGLLTRGYESTTLGFLMSHIDSESLFIDVGAASGIFTLLAASLGAQCIAIEPHPKWLELLQRNVALNKFENKVKITAGAVTSSRLQRKGHQRLDSRVMSKNVIDDDTFVNNSIVLFTLRDVFELHATNNKSLVIKMDIEGAEYGVLSDSDTYNLLQATGPRLFVSFHPGFPCNRDTRNRFEWLLNASYSRFRGAIDSLKVYSNLKGALTCRLPNGRPVRRRLEFVALTFFGAHDFVFDFMKSS